MYRFIEDTPINRSIFIALFVVCLIEAIFIGYFFAIAKMQENMLDKEIVMLQEMKTRQTVLKQQVAELEFYSKKVQQQYMTFVLWMKRDLGTEKVEESLTRMQKYTGIGGPEPITEN